jgi:hypothetical protein
MQHELAALGPRRRGRDRDLAAELVGRSGLALADAFDLRGVEGLLRALIEVLTNDSMSLPASHLRRRLKLYPAAARTALMLQTP